MYFCVKICSKMKRLILFCSSIFLCFLPIFAQKEINFSTRGLAEGIPVHAITQDTKGRMWLALESGICCYDGYDFYNYGPSQVKKVNCLAFRGDTLLIGGEDGLMTLNTGSCKFQKDEKYATSNILNIIDEYVCTDSYLYREGKKIKKAPTEIICLSLFHNDLYLGTMEDLQVRKDGEWSTLFDNEQIVTSILELDGKLFYGTSTLLKIANLETGKIDKTYEMPYVKTMLDSDYGLLIGTDDGLYLYNNGALTHYEHDIYLPQYSIAGNVVWSLFEDRDGNIWIGTNNGVTIIEKNPLIEWVSLGKHTRTHHGNRADYMLNDSKGRTWLGGAHGVICFDEQEKDGYRWYRMNDKDYPIPHNRIRRLYEDQEGRIWVCHDGGLLLHNEKTKQMQFIKVVESKPYWTYDIVQDKKGRLHVAMIDSTIILDGKTLQVLSKEPGRSWTDLPIVHTDAMGRNWYKEDRSGKLYTGFSDRYGLANADDLKRAEIGDEVLICSVTVNGTHTILGDSISSGEIVLHSHENNLTVNFSDLNYSEEHLAHYYYKVKELDENWLPVNGGENRVILGHLSFGSYTLLISSTKDEETAATLKIRIKTPWHLSWPMILLYVIFVLLTLYVAFKYIMQQKTIQLEREERDVMLSNAKKKEEELQHELVLTAKNEESSSTVVSTDDSILKKVTALIEENLENPDFSTVTLAELTELNQKQIYRKIKALTGMTTVEYIRHVRLDHAAYLFKHGNFTIAEVMYKVGFSNASYFTRSFTVQHGCSPSEYRKNQERANVEEFLSKGREEGGVRS